MLQWLVAIFGILALVILFKSDAYCSKSKHSTYYQDVQKPSDKEPRTASIPDSSQYDKFFTKLNRNLHSH